MKLSLEIEYIFELSSYSNEIAKIFFEILKGVSIEDEGYQSLIKSMKENGEYSKTNFAHVILLNLYEQYDLVLEDLAPIHDDLVKRFEIIDGIDDLYLKNITLPQVEQGDFRLGMDSNEPYSLDGSGVGYVNSFGVVVPEMTFNTIGYTYPYIDIISRNRYWMSITINEVNTMKKEIKEATGDVLTLGLGLGYYAYMVSMKDDVSSVTIVETDQDVIDLFEQYILPQFANKDKIKIINQDAFEFMENLEDGKYNYCFCDIWIDSQDCIPYLKLKTICTKFKKTKISYWIEDAFLYSIRTCVITMIQETFCIFLSGDIGNPPPLTEDLQFQYEYMEKIYKKTEITSPKQVKKMIDFNEIRKALTEQKYSFNDTPHKKKKKKK